MQQESNNTLAQSIERLLKANADYAAFVRTTRSYQLAAQGAREAIAAMEKRAHEQPTA